MKKIKEILEKQNEIKYLTYFCSIEKDDSIKLTLSTLGITKKYNFYDENACLQELIDVLLDLKKLESWMEAKLNRDEEYGKKRNYNKRK